MNELARMQYLDALGIDTFVPRLVLPAAKASVQCELPVVSEEEFAAAASNEQAGFSNPHMLDVEPDDRTSAVAEKPVAAGAFVKSLLEPAKTPANRPSKSHSAVAKKVAIPATLKSLIEPQTSERKALRFQLNFWHQPSGLSVLDTREPKAALPTTALLQNIYSVFSPNTHLPQGDLIQWPLIESPVPNPGELQDARDLTQAFLASRCTNAAPKLLLVMGKTAMQMLSETEHLPKYGTSLSVAGLACPVVYLPSLAELLKEPTLKHYIWPAVRSHGF